MSFSRSLSLHLTELTAALDDPEVDLESELSTLTDQIGHVVPSFLGLTITICVCGVPVTLSAVDATVPGSAQTCLIQVLSPGDGTRAGDSVALFASTPDAFRELIADTNPDGGCLDRAYILDRHLPSMTDLPHPPGISGLDEITMLNRAIGKLLAQGATPDEAQRELHRQEPADRRSSRWTD